jgi:hypothetical protein
MKKLTLALLTLAICCGSAIAQTPKAKLGGYCGSNGSNIATASRVWNCEHVGAVTFQQIYEKGFRIVGIYPVTHGSEYSFTYIIIEQQ